MARVPTYDTFQATSNTLPQTRLDMPDFQDVAGRQAQQTGDAMMRVGDQIGRLAIEEQHEANQLRVIDASNQAKEQMFNLLYDKDAGVLNQRGLS